MKYLLVLTLSFAFVCASAQYIPDENNSGSTDTPKDSPVIRAPWAERPPEKAKELPADASAKEEVAYTIELLFDHMRQADGSGVQGLFANDARIMGTSTSNGQASIRNLTIADFARQIEQAAPGDLDEKITSMEVRIDENLATAWVEYDFFYKGNFSHCGVDAVQLHNGSSGWRIIQLADTRRKECPRPDQEINQIMDRWHADAAKANASGYFELIASDGVFLGTDATENWDKGEFYAFAKPYFDKGRVWDFKVQERNVSFSRDGNISWFNELLDTWMGPCRGSGVLRQNASGAWELMQYNLAILVPNELVQDYLTLREEKGR